MADEAKPQFMVHSFCFASDVLRQIMLLGGGCVDEMERNGMVLNRRRNCGNLDRPEVVDHPLGPRRGFRAKTIEPSSQSRRPSSANGKRRRAQPWKTQPVP